MWLYCDDTSGNLSKKWNKHNSILFTAAGLPNDQAHLEYNVHFLATSNIAFHVCGHKNNNCELLPSVNITCICVRCLTRFFIRFSPFRNVGSIVGTLVCFSVRFCSFQKGSIQLRRGYIMYNVTN